MPDRPLHVGIVGFGRIGAEHAGWLLRCQKTHPYAAADATPARQVLARGYNLEVHGHLDNLLADPSIGAVLISTPTAMHCDHAIAALLAGKHVMVEKPMALNFEQARRMIQTAQSRNRVLGVFHNRRWDPDYLAVRAALAGGSLGKIFNVESRLGQWASCVGPAAPEYRPAWRNEVAFGGGGLFDWGSHFLDQIWRLFWPARPAQVFAQLRANVWSKECDDFARVCLNFDDGAAALVEINTTTLHPLPRWHIDGSLGSASSPHSLEFDTRVWSKLEFIGSDHAAHPLPAAKEPALSPTDIWAAFADAVAGNGPLAVMPESVLPTMALLDAARQSSASELAVPIDPKLPWPY